MMMVSKSPAMSVAELPPAPHDNGRKACHNHASNKCSPSNWGESAMPRPLAGIRVIELANFIAGPLAGTLLADMGADVVKVEPPAGDMARASPPIRSGESVSFAALNRNKRSLVLDLKQPQAIEVLLKLAAKSDVFLEAYRPGALARLGLGSAEVSAINPRIVYTSVSGFGQTGPERRRAGVNLIIEAFAGALSVTGEPGRMPMRPGLQTADVFGALFATYAMLASLLGAARHGEGRIADVSLVEASIAAAAWEAAQYLETGQVPRALGNRHRLNAPYQLFETSDGRYLAIGTPNDRLFGQLLQVLRLESHASDPRFLSYASRKAHEDALLAVVEPAVRLRAAPELEAALLAVGVPCAQVNDFKEGSIIRRSSPAAWSRTLCIRGLARCAPPAIRCCSIMMVLPSSGPRRCWASIPVSCSMSSAMHPTQFEICWLWV
jgi:crotonobetainyl-CoA:carnitine CoA-transferase CaiB-like acyl-CoA transferase